MIFFILLLFAIAKGWISQYFIFLELILWIPDFLIFVVFLGIIFKILDALIN